MSRTGWSTDGIDNPWEVPSNAYTVGASGCMYTTIQAAITAASAGELVYVMPGTYTEALTMKAGVDVFGLMADVVGTIAGAACCVKIRDYTGAVTWAADFDLEIRDHAVAAGTIGHTASFNGDAYLKYRECTLTGSAVGGIIGGNADLYVTYERNIIGTSVMWGAVGTGIQGHMHLHGKGNLFNEAGGIFCLLANTGHVMGTVDNVVDAAGTGTAFSLLTDGAVCDISVRSIDCTAAWVTVAGAELDITYSGTVISGTKTGVAKVNGRLELPSGAPIATWCPADSSVIPVIEGQRLLDLNTGDELQARTIGGTTRWHTDLYPISLEPDGLQTATITQWLQVAPRSGNFLWAHTLSIAYDQITGTTGTNYFVLTLDWLGATIASLSTQNQASDEWVYPARITVDTLLNFDALAGTADTTGSQGLYETWTENGGQSMRFSGCLWVSEVRV